MVISVVQSSSGSPAFWMLHPGHSEHMGTGLCVRGQVLLLQLGAVGWVLWAGCCCHCVLQHSQGGVSVPVSHVVLMSL